VKEDNRIKGHALALMTVLIWGTTFISTKTLLLCFKPIEILFFRFSIGALTLFAAYPKRLRLADKKQELMFMAAGLSGITLYCLLESNAIYFTAASNVGVIVSIAPFFTALLANWLLDGEKPKANFYIGFVAAITGIFLISFSGSTVLELNPAGDFIAVAAAFVWAVYSILVRKISQLGYRTVQTTRRIFCYGLLFTVPALFLFHFEPGLARFTQPVNLLNILFLGMGASALCFATWNSAIKFLGAVKTSIYIYLIPVVAVVTSVAVLSERITWMSAAGTALALAGLFISEIKTKHAAPR